MAGSRDVWTRPTVSHRPLARPRVVASVKRVQPSVGREGLRTRMSADLAKARELVAVGMDTTALKALWRVRTPARTNEDEARGLLELACAIRDRNDG